MSKYRIKVSLWTESSYRGNQSVFYFVSKKRAAAEFEPVMKGIEKAKVFANKEMAEFNAWRIREYLQSQLYIGSYCVEVEEV